MTTRLLVAAFLAGLMLIFATGSSLAQTPPAWQDGSTGLRTSSDPNSRSAGLTLAVRAAGSPFLSLQGGVQDAGWNRVKGPTGIDLGEIKVPGATHTLAGENSTWAGDEMAFSGGLSIRVSRLSPAVLVRSDSTLLRLFSGNVTGAVPGSEGLSSRTAPSFPKYVAFPSGGSVQVERISSSGMSIPTLDAAWMLVWYGANSHFSDTRVPTSYSIDPLYGTAGIPATDAYLADAPMLLRFGNPPSSLRNSPEGGIDLSFASPAGYLSLMPLLGRDHPTATETEGWAGGIPDEILSRVAFWADRLCSYPATASESYGYDVATDTATITESLTYVQTCSGGISFAVLPPFVSLAMQQGNPMGISSGGTIVDASYPTEFGPLEGFDGVSSYSWSVSALGRYADNWRMPGTSAVPADLEQALVDEVRGLIARGHLKPWIVADHLPNSPDLAAPYFSDPADIIGHLTEVADSISDPTVRSELVSYIRAERESFPPETVYNVPDTGGLRTPYGSDTYGRLLGARPQLFLKRPSLYGFYALSRYYRLTGDPIPQSVMDSARSTLDLDMSERDWASFAWFRGTGDGRLGVVASSRNLAATIGLVRLARAAGDGGLENLGRSLLAKAAVQRVALAMYPRYLYSADLLVLPSDPGWQAQQTSRTWEGYLYNYDWTGPYSDPRQVALLDQFGAYLSDSADNPEYILKPVSGQWANLGAPTLLGYRDAVPETLRLLSDFAPADASVQADKYSALLPQWYAAFPEAVLGYEHDVEYPINSFEVFMSKALISTEAPGALEKYLDIPWLDAGDLFYMQKLAEVIKAYEGFTWQGGRAALPSRPARP